MKVIGVTDFNVVRFFFFPDLGGSVISRYNPSCSQQVGFGIMRSQGITVYGFFLKNAL